MDDNRLLQEILFELREQRGGVASDNISSGNKKDSRSYGQKVDDLIKSSKEATVQFNKLNSGLRLTSRAQFEHRLAAEDARRELNQLEDALRRHRNGSRLLNDTQLKEVESRRRALESTTKQSQAGDRFAASLTRWGGFLINYFTAVQSATISGISNVLSTVQAGGSGFAIANATMAMNLDIANAHAQQMGTAMQMAGSAVMALPTIGAKIAGASIMLKGQADAAASNLKTMAEKAYNQLLMTGGEQVLKAYKDLTKAGVIVAGGADAMNEALRGRGGKLVISFDELNRMVQENTSTLARANMGVGEAALMMGKVAKVVRENKMERGLTAIGIGIEDFGGIVASVMADMRYNNPSRVLNVPELTAKSIEYAKSLAVLSALTGKSVKELKARGEEARSDLAYQNFMARLKDPKVKEAFDQLPKVVRQSAVQMATYGYITNDSGKLMANQVQGFESMVRELALGLKRGNVSIKGITDVQNRYAKTMVDSVRNNATLNAIAAAGNTKYQTFTEELSEFTLQMTGMGQDVEKVRQGVDKTFTEAAEGPKGGPPTITQTLTDIDLAGKTLVAEFQGKIIDRIPEIGEMIKRALKEANRLIDEGPEAVKRAAGNQLNQISDMWKQMIALGILASIAQVVGSFLMARFFANRQTAALKSEIAKLNEGKAGPTETAKVESTKAQERTRLQALKEKITPKAPSGAALDAARMQFGLSGNATPAQIEAARTAQFAAKYGKYIKGAGGVMILASAANTGMNIKDIREQEARGEISKVDANAKVTAEAFDFAGGLGASAAGGKIGAIFGAAIGAWFGGVGAGPGAIIGGILGAIGGGLAYYLTPATTWVKKIGEEFSKWWQSWSFKGIWDSIGKGLGGAMTSISNWVDDSMKTIKSWWPWGDKTPTPSQAAPPVPPAAAKPAASNTAKPAGPVPVAGQQFAFYKSALMVALAQGEGGNKIEYSDPGLAQLKGAIREINPGTTRPSSSAFYDPTKKTGKVFTEKDFFEYGKGDPMLYAMGKLMKINGEAVEVLRAIAINAKAQVTNTGDTANVLGRIRKQTAFN
jgi:hypothetical protein